MLEHTTAWANRPCVCAVSTQVYFSLPSFHARQSPRGVPGTADGIAEGMIRVQQFMPLTRYRKQKCGGFTYDVKCQPCTNRNVKCSFQEEVKELRFNPYLRLRSSRSPSANFDDPRIDNTRVSAARSSSFLVPDPTACTSGDVELDARHPSSAEEALPKKVDSLQSRFAFLSSIYIILDSCLTGC